MLCYRTVAVVFAGVLLSTVRVDGADPIAPSLKFLDQNWQSGWAEGKANWYHHASQGTMIIPYDWFMALEQPSNIRSNNEPKMFADPEYLSQFGFLKSTPDSTYNPGNLPIGFAISYPWVDPNNTTPKPPVKALGLTCAACHTGEITHGDYRIRIEGGSSLINIGAFQTALMQALFNTNSKSEKFSAFFARWLKSQQIPSKLEEYAKAALKDEVEKAVTSALVEQRIAAELKLHTVDAGFGRTDAMARIGNRVFGKRGKMNLAETNAPVNFPHIWDTSWFYWVQYNASIRLPMVRNIGEALGVGAAINGNAESTVDVKNLHLMEDQLSGTTPFSGLQAPAWPEEILGEIDGFKLANGNWEKGRKLYEKRCIHCHYLIEDYQRTENLDRSENREFWSRPNQFGRKFMKLPFINFTDIGTDPAAVIDFYERIVYAGSVHDDKSTMPAAEALTVMTAKVRDYEYTKLNLSAAEQAEFDGYRELNTEEAAIARLDYKARPLNGVWATPPFLHNGSVANLYELLLPAKQRMKSFYVGSTVFDPKLVGFETEWKAGSFWMDTTVPGNLNTGHEFRSLTPDEVDALTPFQKKMIDENQGWAVGGVVGPLLTKEERMELIEYVKSLGSPQPGQERAPAGELQAIKKLSQVQAMIHRNSPGPDGRPHPEKRGQHPKSHGTVKAVFRVADSLEDRYQVGIFQPAKEYKALIRFSNGDSGDDDLKPNVHGMAIRVLLSDKADAKEFLTEESATGKYQDFVLADNETFFAENADHLLAFITQVMQSPKDLQEKVKEDMAKSSHKGLQGFKKTLTTSPFDAAYYSQTPYKFGVFGAKYQVAPNSQIQVPTVVPLAATQPTSKDIFRDAMAKRLTAENATVSFDFCVQLQTDVKSMPIEDPTKKWTSAFIKLATIKIEPQMFNTSDQDKLGEELSFNPWNALHEHQPLGGINRARQKIYQESQKLRKSVGASR